MRTKRLLFLALGLGLAAQALHAQDFPNRPIKLIVPFNAGGPTDVMARSTGEGLTRRLGQNVVIENRPGGSTLIGMQAVAQSAPDGYTLGFFANSSLTLPATMDKLPVDVVQDFTPITKVIQGAQLFLVSSSVPANTVAELVTYAKANPGKLNFGISGSQELVQQLFNQVGGVQITGVPYKGQDDVTRAFLSGDVQVFFENNDAARRFAAAGKARILASAGLTRSKSAPELPTITETLPTVAWPWFYYVLGPARMPDAVVNRLYTALTEVVREPEYAARLVPFGAEPATMAPKALAAANAEEVALWTKTANTAGIKKQR